MMQEDLIPVLTRLVKGAGDITLRYFQTAMAVEQKSDMSPVTAADRESEQFLRAEIERLYPDDIVLGEEFGTSGSTHSGRRWILDPIDGTRSFVHGVPLYGVVVGVESEGEMVAGAIAIPAAGDLVVAQRGRGCWWNGRPCRVSSTPTLTQALLLTTDVADSYRFGRGRQWDAVSRRAHTVRTWGDCYGYVLVATGRADVMMDPIVELWDVAAAQPIIEEAGGIFSDYEGKRTPHSRCAIATNGVLHAEVLALVQSASASE